MCPASSPRSATRSTRGSCKLERTPADPHRTAPVRVLIALLAYTTGHGNSIANGTFHWALDDQRTTWLVVGFFGFILFYLFNAKLFRRLFAEFQTGTIEQLYLSPLPAWLVVATGRVAAALAETLVVVSLLLAEAALLVHLDIAWRPDALVPLAFLVVGTVGFALIIAALNLLWERIERLNDLLFTRMTLFAGGLIPLSRIPAWIADIAPRPAHDACHRVAPRRRYRRAGAHCGVGCRRARRASRHHHRLARRRRRRVPLHRMRRVAPRHPRSLLDSPREARLEL